MSAVVTVISLIITIVLRIAVAIGTFATPVIFILSILGLTDWSLFFLLFSLTVFAIIGFIISAVVTKFAADSI